MSVWKRLSRAERWLLIGGVLGTLVAAVVVQLISWAGFSDINLSMLLGGLGAMAGMEIGGRVWR
jgi:uncharacterized membrane protein